MGVQFEHVLPVSCRLTLLHFVVHASLLIVLAVWFFVFFCFFLSLLRLSFASLHVSIILSLPSLSLSHLPPSFLPFHSVITGFLISSFFPVSRPPIFPHSSFVSPLSYPSPLDLKYPAGIFPQDVIKGSVINITLLVGVFQLSNHHPTGKWWGERSQLLAHTNTLAYMRYREVLRVV